MAKTGSLRNKKVLITCGPTWVAIDNVRVISNRSTGQMGHLLAGEFIHSGAKVTLLEGPCIDFFAAKGLTVQKFRFYDELRNLLKKELKKRFDIIVHAAAVSDYRLKNPYRGKLRSGLAKLNLVLVPTSKIINKIRKLAPKATLVGFKLEPTHNLPGLRKKAMELINQANCDLVVANSLKNNYHGLIISGEGKILASAASREGLAKQLINVLKDF